MQINKRDGVKKSDILLRQGYVSLTVQGLTAEQWADSMQKRDTPGNKIALHVLCKMYDRHCCVFTSANIWTTIENKNHGFTEDEMLEKCDIKLLFIEPGVFGVLKSKPAMPPPPLRPAQFESAVDILPETHSSDDNGIQPLNLSVLPENESATSYNTSGTVEQTENVAGNSNSQQAVCGDKHPTIEPNKTDADPENPQGLNKKSYKAATKNDTSGISVFKLAKPLGFDLEQLNCKVLLKRLEDVISEESSKTTSEPEDLGYNLRDRNINHGKSTQRAPHAAKRPINYKQDSEFSSDGYTSVSPTQKKQKPDFPMKGPSADRIAARDHAHLKGKEKDAVDALLNLNRLPGGNATGNNKLNSPVDTRDQETSSEETNDSTSSDSMYTSSSTSEDSVQAIDSSCSERAKSSDNETKKETCDSFDSEDDKPLSVIKETLDITSKPANSVKGKPYFKATHHGLRKPRK